MLKKLFPILLLCFFSQTILAQKVTFTHDFAPTNDYIKPQEKPYRDAISLNGLWQFMPVEKAEKLPQRDILNPVLPDNPLWENTPVKVPSPWNVNNFATGDGSGGDFVTYPSYPKNWENVHAGWLMRKIPYRKEWKNKRLILRFEAIGGYSQVFINKHKVAENFDVFLPFEIDVTNYFKADQENELDVWVADGQLLNQPGKYGRRVFVAGSFWGQHVRGIWQDVDLIALPKVNIKNTFIQSVVDSDLLHVAVTLTNTTTASQDVTLSGNIAQWVNQSGKSVVEAPEPKWTLGNTVLTTGEQKIRLLPDSQKTVDLVIKVNKQLHTWSPDDPELYGIVLSAKVNGEVTDKLYTRFGWRQYTISGGNKFYLNGKPIVFKGDSWHFMGIPQMTRRYAWAWFKMLKDANANAVRLHAEPYPQFYLDMADEMGICVLDETGMWASDGGPKVDSKEYWDRSEDHLKRFILRDRNHPSVLGWSVCNENMPVVAGVFHAPDSLVKRQVAEINKWMAITRQYDPSRVWISGDGETQFPLNSPIIIGHYGGSDENYRSLSSKGKVWGIGEAGMAYYATPKQSAEYNGNNSYESQQGRMEGVAMEATKLVNMLKKYNASYMSVFNIIWYGLKPLELGLKDTTQAPQPNDGIFFTNYTEGKCGVQPERLGPYTTTLNPGYDPSLPLYKTWPLFDAIKRSFRDTGMVAMPAAPQSVKSDYPSPAAVNVSLLSTDRDSVLYKILTELGVAVNKIDNSKKTLLIIDGAHIPANGEEVKENVLKQGGNVFIWGTSPSSVKALNKYLPQPIELVQRKATSFITRKDDAILNGLGNADFYFSEITDHDVMTYGLNGDFTHNGNILLQASNTDWKKWNKKAEYLKTAAVLRSERESKPAGIALVEEDQANGKVYVMALDPAILYQSSVNLCRKLLANMGVSFDNNNLKDGAALSVNGTVKNALVLASYDVSGKSDEEISKTNFLLNTKLTSYTKGQQTNGHTWETVHANDGLFDFNTMHFTGPVKNSVGYLSFWIYSPHSLINLLLEPDLPRLDMYIGTETPAEAFLNNNPVKLSEYKGTAVNQGFVIKALPLEKGWNQILIKTIVKNRPWKLSVKFDCDKKEFLMNEVKSQVEHN